MIVRGFVMAVGIFAACGGSLPPPKELVAARAEYERAHAGPANEVTPVKVHEAKRALDRAEAEFAANGDSRETIDWSYIALRRAELAEAEASAITATKERDQMLRALTASRLAEGERAKAELNQTKEQLAKEKAARVEAEARAKKALEDLTKLAAVKEEARGLVITLSGAVLFASNQSTLMPAATSALDNVVTALKSTPDRNIVVEGHTDSQGTHEYNMDLALRRAQSVRDYIVSRGIAPEIITAQGIGPDRPVADNRTPEGRANNRRVEIVVSPAERK